MNKHQLQNKPHLNDNYIQVTHLVIQIHTSENLNKELSKLNQLFTNHKTKPGNCRVSVFHNYLGSRQKLTTAIHSVSYNSQLSQKIKKLSPSMTTFEVLSKADPIDDVDTHEKEMESLFRKARKRLKRKERSKE